MALANGALVGQSGLAATMKVESKFRFKLDLDNAYPTGGYLNFSAFVKAITGVGTRITPVEIRQVSPAGGYMLWWDRANDTLMVYQYPTSLGPATEVPGDTNLAAVTAAEMIVEWV